MERSRTPSRHHEPPETEVDRVVPDLTGSNQARAAAIDGADPGGDAYLDAFLEHPLGDRQTPLVPDIGTVTGAVRDFREHGLGQAIDDRQVSVGATLQPGTYQHTPELDGTTGSRLDTALGGRLGVSGEAIPGRLGVGANIAGLERSTVVGGARDTPLSREVLEERRALMQNGEPGSREAVGAFVDGFSDWQTGDRYSEVAEGGFGVSLRRPGLFSAGVGYATEGSQSRDVTVGEDGQVVVTVGQREAETGSADATFASGVLAASGDTTAADVASQTFAFDIQNEDPAVADAARRDLALYQFAGLMPGTAEALGLDSYEAAVAFIESGADLEGAGADALNAAALVSARTDREFANANGYRGLSEGQEWEQNAGVSAFGLDLLAGNWTQSRGETVAYENGERVELDTGSSTSETRSIFVDDERDGSRVVVDDEGRFSGVHYTSGDPLAGVEGALAPALDDPAVAALVDDPTFVRSVGGDLPGLAEGFASTDLDIDPRRMRSATRHLREQIEGPYGGVGPALIRAAEDSGVDVEVLREEWAGHAERIEALETGEITPGELAESSPDALRLYAELARDLGGQQRFNGIAALATLGDTEGASEMLADVVAAGDSDVLADLQSWAEANGMEDVLAIRTEVVAGSTGLRALNAQLERGSGERIAEEATALLTSIEAAGMDPDVLQETLTGFDQSGAVGDEGGLMRIYRSLPPGERARFMSVVGATEAGQGLLLDVAGTRPDMLLDPSVPAEERAAWLEENALPAMGEAGAAMDPAALAASVETARIAALERGDAWAYGPSAGLDLERYREGPDNRVDTLGFLAEGRGSTAELVESIATLDPELRARVLTEVGEYSDSRNGFFAHIVEDPRMADLYRGFVDETVAANSDERPDLAMFGITSRLQVEQPRLFAQIRDGT